MNLRRILAISKKEVAHIVRDPFTLGIALFLPLLLVSIFGLAIEFNLQEIKLAVYEAQPSPTSRSLLRAFASSHYFRLQPTKQLAAALKLLETERTKAALVFAPDFQAEQLKNEMLSAATPANARAEAATVQILLDGADNSVVGIISSYLAGVNKQFLLHQAATTGLTNTPTTDNLRTRYLFNPELNSQWFSIPGLIVIVLAILSILLTALTIAREWENGSMELLLSTPVKPVEIVIGKLLPYTVIGLLAVLLIYLLARLAFKLPFAGSHLFYGLALLLFILAYLLQGLLISVLTRAQLLSIQLAIMTGMLPSILLSGFIFPIANMPTFFHYLTAIFPARWFMEISRSLFLRGTLPSELLKPCLALGLLNLVLLSLATKCFKKDVEP